MPSLTIKDIPPDLYRRLKRRAAEHRRSLAGEVLVALERAVRSQPIDPAALLARADAVRERMRLPRLTEKALRAARERGRP